MTYTIGIDIGSGAVKSVLFRHDEGGRPVWLAKRCERIRSRDPMTLAQQGYEGVLADAGMTRDEILLEADKFRDFWVAKTKDATKLDWEATWRNWCRNRSSRRKYNPQQSAHDERKARLAAEGKPTTLREALAQRYAGAVQ